MNKNLVVILLVLLIILVSIIIYKRNRNTESFPVNKFNNTNNLEIITENREPEILLIKNFLTREECDHLIIKGDPLKLRAIESNIRRHNRALNTLKDGFINWNYSAHDLYNFIAY